MIYKTVWSFETLIGFSGVRQNTSPQMIAKCIFRNCSKIHAYSFWVFDCFFYKKLWFSGLKFTNPKYDIGRKKFAK